MRTPICARLFGVYVLALSAAAAAQNAVTTHPADIYAGPDDSYPMVGRLDADAPVQVMGCLDDWSWCDVAFGDNRGWLYAPDIVYDYEGGYVPFYTYAPSLGVPVVQFTIGNYWDRYYHGRPWYGQRDEWEHRELHHRRPEGPPPSAGPPPRSARVERPSHAAQPEPPLRLGNAERPRRETEHVVPPDASHENRSNRPERAGPPPHEEHPQGAAEPPRHEERAPPQRRPEAARHEEARPAEKPGERPNDTPH
jgi:uncharacterized protein YraI